MFKKLITIICFFSVVLIIVLFAINGSFLSKKYLDPWRPDYHKQFDDIRIQVIAHGLLAPNAHNMQAWKILLDKNEPHKFSLYINEKRLLPETDPFSRQTIISQGTFLELINISAMKLGFDANIEYFPLGLIDSAGTKNSILSKPVARVALIKNNQLSTNRLYEAIFNRTTNRTPYLDKPLSVKQIKKLEALNNNERLSILVFQNEAELKKIKELAVKGVIVESQLQGPMNETHVVFRYNEYAKNKYRYGLTLSSLGWPALKEFFIQILSTIFPIDIEQEGKIWRNDAKKRLYKTPTYMMIVSSDNSRPTQINTGRLFAKVQLNAAQMGLFVQPIMQVTQEYEQMSSLYEKVHQSFAEKGKTIQMLFRIGHSKKNPKHSPRLNAMDLIKN